MKDIITEIVALLQGHHIIRNRNTGGGRAFKLRDDELNPISFISGATFKRLNSKGVLKKNKKGFFVVSKRGLQQCHGGTKEKRTYKNERNTIQSKGPVSRTDGSATLSDNAPGG